MEILETNKMKHANGQFAGLHDEYLLNDKQQNETRFDIFGNGGRLGFEGLAKKISKEYEEKGYSKQDAREIGNKVAGKIFWEQQRKKGYYQTGGIIDDTLSLDLNTLPKDIQDAFAFVKEHTNNFTINVKPFEKDLKRLVDFVQKNYPQSVGEQKQKEKEQDKQEKQQHNKYYEAIEGLKVMLEMEDDADMQQKYLDAISGLEVMAEI